MIYCLRFMAGLFLLSGTTFHKYLLRLDILLSAYCVQLCAWCCGAERNEFSTLEDLTAYANRK